jgi:hypothetical protein
VIFHWVDENGHVVEIVEAYPVGQTNEDDEE